LYFDERDAFADYVVHECAHIFHNTKGATLGLARPPRREWLLDISFDHRETFAYCCEAYRRIIEQASSIRERLALVQKRAKRRRPPNLEVDFAEYLDILRDAVSARNGWKRILARCAPPRPAPGGASS
jgi:hypothetical protein